MECEHDDEKRNDTLDMYEHDIDDEDDDIEDLFIIM